MPPLKKDLVEQILVEFGQELWGGHLEMTDEVKELVSEKADEILEVFS